MAEALMTEPIPLVLDDDVVMRVRGTRVTRALLRAKHEIDVGRAQDAGLTGIDGTALLVWAAEHHRVLLTHIVSTMS